ncbi:hypothetical protein C7974DRAFT_399013 [Boeremia exigua]|uniref:uncharacterized protein n=1 Tax=Boeremia exigua TaxID=749465 RepID=UPI001E8EDB03|nr:uncharacterized protein C7974DRAFT_399013 [Boeremia exigua]KAH6620156.1 hypothetical protein C7974DRAFT_399013 [Boeremia exigua]
MAGPRANLAVTKDGEPYNRLQRPDNLLHEHAPMNKATERKRERAAVDRPMTRPTSANKRAKMNHPESTANSSPLLSDSYRNRSAATVAECGMRFTLPIEEDQAQDSDDSLGEALAYLRSVRSEASTIPNLLVAPTTQEETVKPSQLHTSKTLLGQRAFYQDGAWISIDESYGAAYSKDHEPDETDPQASYHKQLIKRFEILRSNLNRNGVQRSAPPGIDASQASPAKPPSNRHDWLYTIDREYPTPDQVFQLDENNARRGLEYCAHAMDRFDTISKQKSCWTWTLLALSGDIGTLDSQKMSHIRDLGNKAAEMSIALHTDFRRQNGDAKYDVVRADLADDVQDGKNEIDKANLCDASRDTHDSATGYVRSDADKDLKVMPRTLLNEAAPGAQDAQLRSDVSNDVNEETNTDKNNDTLKEARACLLAQLGDNLVQAGIPVSTTRIADSNTHHSGQHDPDLDVLQHEIQARAIPSRAEAERQRQIMRMRESATQRLRDQVPTLAKPSVTIRSVSDDHGSCTVDLNTRVTIDMILTVVAECYGQRDLLEFRKPW